MSKRKKKAKKQKHAKRTPQPNIVFMNSEMFESLAEILPEELSEDASS